MSQLLNKTAPIVHEYDTEPLFKVDHISSNTAINNNEKVSQN